MPMPDKLKQVGETLSSRGGLVEEIQDFPKWYNNQIVRINSIGQDWGDFVNKARTKFMNDPQQYINVLQDALTQVQGDRTRDLKNIETFHNDQARVSHFNIGESPYVEAQVIDRNNPHSLFGHTNSSYRAIEKLLRDEINNANKQIQTQQAIQPSVAPQVAKAQTLYQRDQHIKQLKTQYPFSVEGPADVRRAKELQQFAQNAIGQANNPLVAEMINEFTSLGNSPDGRKAWRRLQAMGDLNSFERYDEFVASPLAPIYFILYSDDPAAKQFRKQYTKNGVFYWKGLETIYPKP